MKIKKRIYIIAAIMISVFFILPCIGNAANTPVFYLLADNVKVQEGEQYGIKLCVANAMDIYGFEATVSYGHRMTEFVAEGSKAAYNEGFSFFVKPEAGSENPVILVYTGIGKAARLINGDADLFTVNFRAKKAGNEKLILESVKVCDSEGNMQTYTIGSEISIEYTGGSGDPGDSDGPGGSSPGEGSDDTGSGSSGDDVRLPDEAIPGGGGYNASISSSIPGLPKSTPVYTADGTYAAWVDLEGLEEDIFSDRHTSTITLPSIPGMEAYTLNIPADSLSGVMGTGEVGFVTDMGSIRISGNMLKGIPGAEGKDIAITIGKGDKSDLAGDIKKAIGDRPLIQLTLTLDGVPGSWDNPDAPVMVSIPYTPTKEEQADPEHIVVWYIDGGGKALSIPNGRYDNETGMVTFSVAHFSYYAIAYVHKTFNDLDSVPWAAKAIEVMASKGIIAGTGGNAYSPALNITRADYLLLLVRTLELRAEVDDNFDDVDPAAYYYEGVGIAKKLGIATGVGNNRFSPRENISRQDMMVLTARALEKLKGLATEGSAAVLEQFTDRGDIAGYAAEYIAALVAEDLIKGSDGKVNPRGWTTRAEAAVFIYRIYNKYP